MFESQFGRTDFEILHKEALTGISIIRLNLLIIYSVSNRDSVQLQFSDAHIPANI